MAKEESLPAHHVPHDAKWAGTATFVRMDKKVVVSTVVTLVDSLLNDLQAKDGGHLIENFASAIPVEVIGNLLGVLQADSVPFRGW